MSLKHELDSVDPTRFRRAFESNLSKHLDLERGNPDSVYELDAAQTRHPWAEVLSDERTDSLVILYGYSRELANSLMCGAILLLKTLDDLAEAETLPPLDAPTGNDQ